MIGNIVFLFVSIRMVPLYLVFLFSAGAKPRGYDYALFLFFFASDARGSVGGVGGLMRA